MSFYAYILRSLSSGRYYVGHTSNLACRLTEHHRDHTVSLKNRGPWAVVYSEEFSTRSEAARREQHSSKRCSVPRIRALENPLQGAAVAAD